MSIFRDVLCIVLLVHVTAASYAPDKYAGFWRPFFDNVTTQRTVTCAPADIDASYIRKLLQPKTTP